MTPTTYTPLVCPECYNPFPADTTDHMQCDCGNTATCNGSVWDFLSQNRASQEVSLYERFSEWMIDRGDDIRAAYLADPKWRQAGSSFEQFLQAHLPADLSVADFRAIQQELPFAQVLNDVGDYQGKDYGSHDTDLREFVRQQLKLESGHTLLDAGCSTGRNFLNTPEGVQCIGFDITESALQIGAAYWRSSSFEPQPLLCAADILNMPLPNESCTHIQSFGVFGLVPIDEALEEASRVLCERGHLVFTLGGPGFLRECWDNSPVLSYERVAFTRWHIGRKLQEMGIRWQKHKLFRRLAGIIQYTPATLRREVERAGFTVENIEVVREYRQLPRVIGVSARKG